MSATTEPKHYQCRHIHHDGRRCGSPSLRGELFCYYHHTSRAPKPVELRDTLSTFDLPLPEDRASIQASIGIIVQRIAHGCLDSKRAGLLLYVLQIASLNLPKPSATQPEPVQEVVADPTHGLIAPESEILPPVPEKSWMDVLLEDFRNDDTPITPQAVAEEDSPLSTENYKLQRRAFRSRAKISSRHKLTRLHKRDNYHESRHEPHPKTVTTAIRRPLDPRRSRLHPGLRLRSLHRTMFEIPSASSRHSARYTWLKAKRKHSKTHRLFAVVIPAKGQRPESPYLLFMLGSS